MMGGEGTQREQNDKEGEAIVIIKNRRK